MNKQANWSLQWLTQAKIFLSVETYLKKKTGKYLVLDICFDCD